MRLRATILVGTAVCGFPWAADAQPIQGFYIDLGLGGRAPFATKTTPLAPGFGTVFDINQRAGLEGVFSLGYAPGNGWRFEVEGNLSRNAISGVSRPAYPSVTSGNTRHLGGMVNALFDLDIGSPWVFPYLGLGAGYQSTRLNGFAVTRTDAPFTYTASGVSGGFAAQAIVGLSFPVPYAPGLSVTLDYRLMDILGGEKFSGVSAFGPSPAPAPVQGSVKLHNQFSQSGILSIRYAFNTPPPPVTADPTSTPPPAAQVNTFSAAFDPGQATLTRRGEAMVKEAARGRRAARIEVAGETDGDATLPERRARSVRLTLAGAGVPKDAILVRGADETRPAFVPRANRFVEIVLK